MRNLIRIAALFASTAASAQYVAEPYVAAPELTPDGNCVNYTNYTQKGVALETVIVHTTLGPVTFHMSRGEADQPDVAKIWEAPTGVIGTPLSIQLEEYESGRFCFEMYEGM